MNSWLVFFKKYRLEQTVPFQELEMAECTMLELFADFCLYVEDECWTKFSWLWNFFSFCYLSRNWYPSAWRLGFLAKKFLGFLKFLAKILARFARFCKFFQDRGKKSKKIFGLLVRKSKNNQDLGKRNKKSLNQNNARSIDILNAFILENSKKGYSCWLNFELLLCGRFNTRDPNWIILSIFAQNYKNSSTLVVFGLKVFQNQVLDQTTRNLG